MAETAGTQGRKIRDKCGGRTNQARQVKVRFVFYSDAAAMLTDSPRASSWLRRGEPFLRVLQICTH